MLHQGFVMIQLNPDVTPGLMSIQLNPGLPECWPLQQEIFYVVLCS